MTKGDASFFLFCPVPSCYNDGVREKDVLTAMVAWNVKQRNEVSALWFFWAASLATASCGIMWNQGMPPKYVVAVALAFQFFLCLADAIVNEIKNKK